MLFNNILVSSPRRWGCFRERRANERRYKVFPTQVGVFPKIRIADEKKARLPHAGGGVSYRATCKNQSGTSSPRRWGCFYSLLPLRAFSLVFPTQVGVFLKVAAGLKDTLGLPHAGGGVSQSLLEADGLVLSSPRRWGCFQVASVTDMLMYVFPTQVGVFLHWRLIVLRRFGLPHAGGGVSHETRHRPSNRPSSPRRWGCFPLSICVTTTKQVFPTQVGVFLHNLTPYS